MRYWSQPLALYRSLLLFGFVTAATTMQAWTTEVPRSCPKKRSFADCQHSHDVTVRASSGVVVIDNKATRKKLARQIRKSASVEEALRLWEPYGNSLDASSLPGSENVCVELMNVCARHNNYQMALELVSRTPSLELVRSKAISISGSCGRLSEALALLYVNNETPSPKQDAEENSVAKRQKQNDSREPRMALFRTAAPYNAAIAACGGHIATLDVSDFGSRAVVAEWESAISILENMPRRFVSRVTMRAVLTVLAKAQRPIESVKVLHDQASVYKIPPDLSCYHICLSTLLGAHRRQDVTHRNVNARNDNEDEQISGSWLQQACDVILEMRTLEDRQCHPNEDTLRRLAAALGSTNQAALAFVKRKLPFWNPTSQPQTTPEDGSKNSSVDMPDATKVGLQSFTRWSLPRRGRGKESFWQLGTFTTTFTSDKHENQKEIPVEVLVGLQPNRNPAANGMRLVFYQLDNDKCRKDREIADVTVPRTKKRSKGGDDPPMTRLGHLLMINASSKRSSQFLGQFVQLEARGHGWSKVFLALWLYLCLEAKVQPCTGKMQKPLLSLVLQHAFGFVPRPGGVEAELSRPVVEGGRAANDAKARSNVVLYSPTGRSLEGALSPLDLRNQGITLSLVPPEPRGRMVVIGTGFVIPPQELDTLRVRVKTILQDQWLWHEDVDPNELSNVLLGTG